MRERFLKEKRIFRFKKNLSLKAFKKKSVFRIKKLDRRQSLYYN